MNESINNFIQRQRDAFDVETPGPENWPGVQRALDRWPEADALERFLLGNRHLLDTAEAPADGWLHLLNHLPGSLETFLRDNRQALDSETPGAGLWDNITQSLPQKPRARTVSLLSWQRFGALARAAAGVALLITGLGLGYWYGAQQPPKPAGLSMSEVSTEYAELEQYYQRDIASKQQELVRLAGNHDNDVLSDLRQMDQSMQELRTELAKVPPGNREQVVRAMIENYKAKLAILQRVLEHLQPSSDSKNSGKNETKSI